MIKAWIVGTEGVIARLDAIPGKMAAALRGSIGGTQVSAPREGAPNHRLKAYATVRLYGGYF